MEDMTKATVAEKLGDSALPAAARRALEIRRSVGKASVKKINSLLAGRDADGRARGLLQFHAASTGRWGGRRFQPQNIKRPEIKNVDLAIRLLLRGDWEEVELVYGDPLSVVGDCLRGMVRADDGRILLASDFSNIEGRGLAWLAGEQWKLDAFRDYDNGIGPDLYKLAYARAFLISINQVDGPMRQIGKVMELALGYEGGVGAFQTMAGNYGIQVSSEYANELKHRWRNAHPRTKALWRSLIDAAVKAIGSPGTRAEVNGKLAFLKRGSFLFMRLPSGRVITYPHPRLVEMVWVEDVETGKRRTMTLVAAKREAGIEYDAEQAYMGAVYYGQNAKTRQWGDVSLYGGILAENAVQAISRDVFADAMLRVESSGYPVVLHVHDEVMSEVPAAGASFDEFNALMSITPSWAQGFPIVAAGWSGERYRK
jgi:DNA polymerase